MSFANVDVCRGSTNRLGMDRMTRADVGRVDQLERVTGGRATRTDDAVVHRVEELWLESEAKRTGDWRVVARDWRTEWVVELVGESM